MDVMAVIVLLVAPPFAASRVLGLLLPMDAAHPAAWLPHYVVVIGAALAWWLAYRRRTPAALGLSGPPSRAARAGGAGVLAGVALVSTVVALGVALSAWSVAVGGTVDAAGIAGWTCVLVVAALYEEVLLRGILLQALGRRGVVLGAVGSSLVFAGMHLLNPEVASHGAASAALAFVAITAAGILLGAAFLWSGNLWFPWGLHLGWNWTLALLFGLPVSGFTLPSILRGSMSEPARTWAGSAFGPESSAIAVVVVAAVGVPWLWAARRKPLPLTAGR